jgi:hypothetical protein
VISHILWRDRLGSDPNLVGRTVTLNGNKFTVIGIAPPGFTGPFITAAIDLWVPAMMLEQAVPGHRIGLNDRSLESWGAIGWPKPKPKPGSPDDRSPARIRATIRITACHARYGISILVFAAKDISIERG